MNYRRTCYIIKYHLLYMNPFALLVECDPGTTLGGSCYRDVKNMAEHLVNRCNFKSENIYILTTSPQENTDKFNYGNSRSLLPTLSGNSNNIFDYATEIINKNPSFFVLLLSGHGFEVPNTNGDKMDGYDDAVNVGKMILDDDLYSNIVLKLKCPAMMLSDTCHSGTMFDLPYIWNGSQFTIYTKRNDTINYKMFSLSACSDSQCSMCDVGETTGFGGSLTTAVLNEPNVLEDLINHANIMDGYNKIQNQLQMLGQTVVLSTSQKN